MPLITPIRTKGMQIELKELSIGDAVDICQISSKLREFGTSQTIRAICKDDINPLLLTVQERAFIIAQYIAQTNGVSADFAIGENGKYSDYLYYDVQECKERKEVGIFNGKKLYAMPILGVHVESIERLISQGVLESALSSWVFALMVCMFMFEDEFDDENDFSQMNDAQVDEYITKGVINLTGMPESQFIVLADLFAIGIELTNHLFKVLVIEDGIVFSRAREGVDVEIPPCRFQFKSVLSEFVKTNFGAIEEPDV